MPNDIDPLLLEVIQNGFSTVADEMALILMRSAHSMIVRDSMDFSTAVCDAEGRIVGQGGTSSRNMRGTSVRATCSSAMIPIWHPASTSRTST
jgi:N-methylhydantoinase B